MNSVLEKELTCSICTDILFDPITFLDCLHSNCGSCAKSWFDSREEPTCPICRDPVRDARPNAAITSLLEDFLQKNPEKTRTKEDQDNCRKIYKPGDRILGSGRRGLLGAAGARGELPNINVGGRPFIAGMPRRNDRGPPMVLSAWGFGNPRPPPMIRFEGQSNNNRANEENQVGPFSGIFPPTMLDMMPQFGNFQMNGFPQIPGHNHNLPIPPMRQRQLDFNSTFPLRTPRNAGVFSVNAGNPLSANPFSEGARRNVNPQNARSLSELVLSHQRVDLNCDGCRKDINNLLHYECIGCYLYHLCVQCYRTGATCRQQGQPNHIFHPQRLVDGTLLQLGIFCSMCDGWVDEDRNNRDDSERIYFWHCEKCNDGVWTYCQKCVRQGHCCNHSLTLWTNERSHPPGQLQSPVQGLKQGAVLAGLPGSTTINPPTRWLEARRYRRWTDYQTICDICECQVRPTHNWMHCNTCEVFDTCTGCVSTLTRDMVAPHIRQCPQGHPLTVVSPDGSQGGRIRYTVIPPVKRPEMILGDGQTARAVRGVWPESGDLGLKFPKGAELSDVCFAFEGDQSTKWWWGCYAGSSGLFEDGTIEIEEDWSL